MFSKKNLYSTMAIIVAAILVLTLGFAPAPLQAASHREAPLISMDPTADITDFFFFRSYEAGREDNVVMIMDVIPAEEPGFGPNYYNFDPNVLYAFHIDNNQNGKANDFAFEVRFKNEFRGVPRDLGLFLNYVAVPPITALDGEGSEGLGLRQSYTVTMVKDGKRTEIGNGLFAVPSNVGPRTMPDYPSLAAQGIYELAVNDQQVRVFAGQRDDPFYIDVGAIFDTLNLRRAPLPLLTAEEDANDDANPFGIDTLGGFNVHTIALEVPASLLTRDKKDSASTERPKLGAYSATYRKKVTVIDTSFLNQSDSLHEQSDSLNEQPESLNEQSDSLNEQPESRRGQSDSRNEKWVQIQRMANPLVNETIIGTVDKDRWNMTYPEKEKRFLDYYLNPRLAAALELVFEVPAGKTDRTDLVDLLLKYKPEDTRLSELLRLDLSVSPTPLGSQQRMGPLATDAAGMATPDPAAWPNGRRPIDDVTDIAVRVVGGTNYIQGLAGDGVNTNDVPYPEVFPFLPTPADGVNRVHSNP